MKADIQGRALTNFIHSQRICLFFINKIVDSFASYARMEQEILEILYKLAGRKY